MASKAARVAGLVTLLCAAAASPLQAADCQLKDTVRLRLFETKPSDLFTPAAAPVITTSYRLGEPFDVKLGELVLRRQVNPAGQTATFAEDVEYGTSLPFTTKYTLQKDHAYTLLDIPSAPTLRALVLPTQKEGTDEYLFLNAEGRLCEHALTYVHWNENISYRAGSYHAKPDVAATLTTGTPDATRGDNTAIILAGIDAAGIDFTTRASVDGKMGEAQHRAFDRRNGQLDIDGFKLKIEEIREDGLRLSVVGEPGAPD